MPQQGDFRGAQAMRILFINPNTGRHLTELGIAVARKHCRPGTEFIASTGRFGAAYISSRAAAAIAAHAVLDCYAHDGKDADVALIACFGDPGLFALRELARVPVVGMAEASCIVAAKGGRRFAIVTGGERWHPMLEEFVASIGLREQLAAIRTVSLTGGEIAADPAAAIGALKKECRRAVAEAGAEAIILGGIGLAGLTERMDVGVPLIDSVRAAVEYCESIDLTRFDKPRTGTFAATPRVETRGLSGPLAALIAPDA